jgi:hypothetical protein
MAANKLDLHVYFPYMDDSQVRALGMAEDEFDRYVALVDVLRPWAEENICRQWAALEGHHWMDGVATVSGRSLREVVGALRCTYDADTAIANLQYDFARWTHTQLGPLVVREVTRADTRGHLYEHKFNTSFTRQFLESVERVVAHDTNYSDLVDDFDTVGIKRAASFICTYMQRCRHLLDILRRQDRVAGRASPAAMGYAVAIASTERPPPPAMEEKLAEILDVDVRAVRSVLVRWKD